MNFTDFFIGAVFGVLIFFCTSVAVGFLDAYFKDDDESDK